MIKHFQTRKKESDSYKIRDMEIYKWVKQLQGSDILIDDDYTRRQEMTKC